MIEYLLLLSAPLLGILLYHLTEDEKNIYQKQQYFPTIIPLLTILSITFLFNNKELFLTHLYLLLMTATWASR